MAQGSAFESETRRLHIPREQKASLFDLGLLANFNHATDAAETIPFWALADIMDRETLKDTEVQALIRSGPPLSMWRERFLGREPKACRFCVLRVGRACRLGLWRLVICDSNEIALRTPVSD